MSLVGAGPGDPGLLTLKGRDRLAGAGAVVYDRLVDPAVLALAPPSADLFYVGKGRASSRHTQDEVNDLLVDLARRGLQVVRLKGGDPFLFGRGAEEVAALADAGIEVEVVPGVSSALGVPATAGIPATDRRAASSCAIVTGHLHPDDPDCPVEWGGLAANVDTIVVLMGMEHLGAIAETLARHGRPEDTPAAVIESGTRPSQRTLIAKLGNIAAIARDAGARPPGIIVFGDVVALRREPLAVPMGVPARLPGTE